MATPIDSLLNVFVIFFPLLVIAIPLIFLHSGIKGKIYKRFYYGITIFFLVYFILPSIFQIGIVEDTFNYSKGPDFGMGIIYLINRTIGLIFNYFQYPILIFPFVFLFAPFISLLMLWNQLRKDEGSFSKNLNDISLTLKKSPVEVIKDNLQGGWDSEKQIFKLLAILLPISLYLLTTILKIAGLIQEGEALSVQTGSALGWFLEIFFAYLATFIFGINLLKSSNLSYKGRFLGEKVVEDTSTSLTTVGTPISLLSILLFLVEYSESISLIIYFFGYFLMAAFIFVTYVAYMQPISTIIFIKMIDHIKNRHELERANDANNMKSNESVGHSNSNSIAGTIKKDVSSSQSKGLDFLLSALFTLLCVLIAWLLSSWIFGYSIYSTLVSSNLVPQDVPLEDFYNNYVINSIYYDTENALFEYGNLFEIIGIVQGVIYIAITLSIGLLLSYSIKFNRKIGFSTLTFFGIFTLLAFLVPMFNLLPTFYGLGDENILWYTGKLVTTNVFNEAGNIFIIRTAFLPAVFENPTLLILALPYTFLRYISAFMLWGIWFYYIQKKFLTKSIPKGDLVHVITFSNMDQMPSGLEFQKKEFLISSNPEANLPESERVEVKQMYEMLERGKLTSEIMPESKEDVARLYATLRYMTVNNWVIWWVPEFSFTFIRAELDGLYVMYSDGRDVISYMFSDTTSTDPALVAGMFSAITSFISETTKSKDFLRTIDHGDSKITIEYGKYVFGAIFANMENTEIRTKLKEFLETFESRHHDVLQNWNGNTAPFKEDYLLIEEIFEVEK